MNTRPLLLVLTVTLLPALLAACAPGTVSPVSAPTFRVISSETSLQRIDPQGVGRSSALVHIELEATNPNPFGLVLAELDSQFFLAGQEVASSAFREGVSLPARGSSRLGLDIVVPVSGAAHLLGQLARLVAGDPVAYRLDAVVGVDFLGSTQRFPTATLAQGSLEVPGGLRPPTVRFDPDATDVKVSGLTAQIDVGLTVDNPVPIGYLLSAPDLELRLDGARVAAAELGPVPVAASGRTSAVVSFRVGLAEAGAAIARLQSGVGGVQLAMEGQLELNLPGISSQRASLENVTGLLR